MSEINPKKQSWGSKKNTYYEQDDLLTSDEDKLDDEEKEVEILRKIENERLHEEDFTEDEIEQNTILAKISLFKNASLKAPSKALKDDTQKSTPSLQLNPPEPKTPSTNDGIEKAETTKEKAPRERRRITEQIRRNEGLKRYRNKKFKNARAKTREKWRRKQIRVKGFRPEMRRLDGGYLGEMTGINANVVKSVRLDD